MKKIYSIIFASLLIASCSIEGPEFKDGLVTISLKTAETEVATKAVGDGVDELGENLISEIHYYIFTDEEETSILNKTQVVSKNTTAKVALSISKAEFAAIFPGASTNATIYVVANAGSLLNDTNKTISEIEATAFTITPGTQSSFIMTGKSTLVKDNSVADADKASASVELRRSIAKITIALSIADTFVNGSTTWTSEKSSTIINVTNLNKNGLINGISATNSLFTVNANGTQTDPLYTCARAWEISDSDMPCINITVPWNNGTETKPTFYKVLLSTDSFEANKWYDYAVSLDGLGSLDPSETVEVSPLTFTVADWNTAAGKTGSDKITEAEIEEVRILTVDKNEYTMYNTNTLVIPFKSSHPCNTTVEVSMTTTHEGGGAVKTYSATLDNTTKTVTLVHDLVNDQTTKPYDYTDYNFTITIKHADKPDEYNETIHVRQIPALYVTFEDNEANGESTTFVDKISNAGTEKNDDKSGRKTYQTYSRGDYSRNVYNIKVSTLDGVELKINNIPISFAIGDPRERVNFLSSLVSDAGQKLMNNAAPDMSGDQSQHLTHYYRTNPNSSYTIAPEFRLASGWCSQGSLKYKECIQKCATYQEAGYPAGRWRMPTQAEMAYIIKLQSDGYIEPVFNNNGSSGYICADQTRFMIETNGNVIIDTRAEKQGGGSFRCVYDSWYWDNTQYPRLDDKTVFTWGDEQIY